MLNTGAVGEKSGHIFRSLPVYQQTQDPNYKPPISANLDHGSQPPSSDLEPVLKFPKGRVDFSMGFGLDP